MNAFLKYFVFVGVATIWIYIYYILEKEIAEKPKNRLLVLFILMLFRMREIDTATEKEFGIVLQVTPEYILTQARIQVK